MGGRKEKRAEGGRKNSRQREMEGGRRKSSREEEGKEEGKERRWQGRRERDRPLNASVQPPAWLQVYLNAQVEVVWGEVAVASVQVLQHSLQDTPTHCWHGNLRDDVIMMS